jgi:hypothetical protein
LHVSIRFVPIWVQQSTQYQSYNERRSKTNELRSNPPLQRTERKAGAPLNGSTLGPMRKDPTKCVDRVFESVTLETCQDSDVTRPRVRPVDTFPDSVRVEFPRAPREDFPIGTRFRATMTVCQKHSDATGLPKGPPYLRATEIGVIVSSIKDKGLRAKLKPGSISGRSYYYVWEQS